MNDRIQPSVWKHSFIRIPVSYTHLFEGHNIARKKLRSELQLFMQGERNVEKYREAGINWWDYCG